MNHEPECPWAGQPDDDKCPTCNLLRMGYKRGREDAGGEPCVLEDALAKITQVIEIAMSGRGYIPGRAVVKAIRNILKNAAHNARGAQPHQGDTNQHPDSQRFRYGFGNSISSAGNTILDDSDDEKVVADNYVDNVTDAGDTPQAATNWVRSPLQPGDVDTPDTEQSEPINEVVRTVSPAVTLQNRQDEERFASLRICGPGDIDETVPGPSESDYIVANIARILDEFPKSRSTLSVQVLIKQIRDAIGDR